MLWLFPHPLTVVLWQENGSGIPCNGNRDRAAKGPAGKWHRSRKIKVGQTLKGHGKGNLGDQCARRRCTGVEMRPSPKRNGRTCITRNIKACGVWEISLVMSGRREHEKHPVTGLEAYILDGFRTRDTAR